MGILDLFKSQKQISFEETIAFVNQINSTHQLAPIDVEIMLSKGERAYYVEEGANLGKKRV